MSKVKTILIINPNSTENVTDGIREAVRQFEYSEGGFEFKFAYVTAPETAPPSINDAVTSVESAMICYDHVTKLYQNNIFSGIIVACFSMHPLIQMLREWTSSPVLGILDASIGCSLLYSSKKFGFITTGPYWINEFEDAVRNFIGASSSERYAGTICTNLGVVELRTRSANEINEIILSKAVELSESRNAKTIILGCAGMYLINKIIIVSLKNYRNGWYGTKD